jgi:hypothetical protein
VEKLLQEKSKANLLKPISQEYVAAYQAFVSKRTHIENTIKESVKPHSISPEGLNTAMQFLGDNIAAALQFGDMELVTDEMEWLKALLQAHQKPPQELTHFMEIYSQAADKHFNRQGNPIKAWLNAQI